MDRIGYQMQYPLSHTIYATIGKISVAIIIGIVILLFLTLILGYILVKKQKLILPSVLLFSIDTFYLQIKSLARRFGIAEKTVDQIGIEVRNGLNKESFSSIDARDRILVVPQCLRHEKCPARLDSMEGVTCKGCGMCDIKELKKEAERLGYRFYIVPGGTFVERIIKRVRPRAALGVACHRDLYAGMHRISRAECAVQGVPLIRDGCIHTEVDIKELLRKMRAGIEDTVEEIEKGCSPDEIPKTG